MGFQGQGVTEENGCMKAGLKTGYAGPRVSAAEQVAGVKGHGTQGPTRRKKPVGEATPMSGRLAKGMVEMNSGEIAGQMTEVRHRARRSRTVPE